MNQPLSHASLHDAVGRAGDSEPVRELAKNVFEVLTPEEIVLEIAETTTTGAVTGMCITNQRILLHEGNKKGNPTLSELPLEGITRFDFRFDKEITLKVSKFSHFIEYHGIGHQGAARLAHAIKWIRTMRETRSPRMPRRAKTIDEMFTSWQNAVAQVQQHSDWDPAFKEMTLNESISGPFWNDLQD